jgi:predicted flap endonuclease-1-like 5' DNA nuclease
MLSLVVAGAGLALLVWLLWWLWTREKKEHKEPAVEAKRELVSQVAEPEMAKVSVETAAPEVVAQIEVKAPEVPAVAEPRAAAVPPAADDLTRIEGIGPKIASVLQAAGITTFAQLADADVQRLREILEHADPRLLRLAQPATWPEQSALAAAGAWEALEALQNQLKGGRRV